MSDHALRVWVTGADGQLGQALQRIALHNQHIKWTFTKRRQVDIADPESIRSFTKNKHINFIVNCAAYTGVEAAETNVSEAFEINSDAVLNLVTAANEIGATLIHISTDYVFDGKKNTAYLEDDHTNPINVYGKSKLEGEKNIRNGMERFYIIRTSWLYSEYGHNFFNTIREKIRQNEQLRIVTDQRGCPTNAHDLAQAILIIIESRSQLYGIYHICNRGLANWYIFAKEIIRNLDSNKLSLLEAIDSYPTQAKRPVNSELNIEKFETAFKYQIPDWKTSLRNLTNRLKED